MDDSEVRATQAWPEGVGVALTLCILRYSCRDHKDDASLPHKSTYAVAAWPVKPTPMSFRFIRLFQTGTNADGDNHLCCGGIELCNRALHLFVIAALLAQQRV
jgi:hypothetical protein